MLSACGGFKLGGREISGKFKGRYELNTAIGFLACTKQVTSFLKLLSTASYAEIYSNHQ